MSLLMTPASMYCVVEMTLTPSSSGVTMQVWVSRWK